MDNKFSSGKKEESAKKPNILTTEKCPRCLHPARKNPQTGEVFCGNCGLKFR